MVLGPSLSAARTSARFDSDFDPGTSTTARRGPAGRGARQGPTADGRGARVPVAGSLMGPRLSSPPAGPPGARTRPAPAGIPAPVPALSGCDDSDGAG